MLTPRLSNLASPGSTETSEQGVTASAAKRSSLPTRHTLAYVGLSRHDGVARAGASLSSRATVNAAVAQTLARPRAAAE